LDFGLAINQSINHLMYIPAEKPHSKTTQSPVTREIHYAKRQQRYKETNLTSLEAVIIRLTSLALMAAYYMSMSRNLFILFFYLFINQSIHIKEHSLQNNAVKKIKQMYGLNGEHRAGPPLTCSKNIAEHSDVITHSIRP